MKKGFTLIELLAVIVILAIIALIATPIVLNIINETKESAQLRSAEFYLDAVETAIASSTLNNKKLENKTYNILESGNLCIEYKDKECTNELKVKVSGEVPSSGSITIENGKIKYVELVLNDKTITRQGGVLAFGEDGKIDENATDASCFGVDPIISKYEIGPNCDAYIQEAFGAEALCSDAASNGVDFLTALKDAMYWGQIDKKSIEELEEDGIITDVEITNNVSITNYTCGGLEDNKDAIRDVIIPSKINGKLVTRIDSYAFSGLDDEEKLVEEKLIDSIVIPNSVTSIGYSAFSENQLTSVVIPNNIIAIEDYTFSGNNFKSIIIPDSVTTIGENAFANNSSLISVVIPDNVTSIGREAFADCTSLETVRMGNKVTSIGNYAFMGCTSLESIIIPKSVINLGMGIFKETNNFITINYMGTEEEWNQLISGLYVCNGCTVNYNYVVQ